MNWETYIAFGDSITIGARSYLGYPEYTGKILEKKTNKTWNVINHAISGYKAIELARSIDTHFTHLKANVPSICTLLIGTNDIKTNVDPEDFEIALKLVLTKIKLIMEVPNIKVLAIPLFPAGVMYPYHIGMNESISLFNEIIRKTAEMFQVQFHPLALNHEDLFDGVHLNKAGCMNTASYISTLILKDRGL